MSNPHAGGWVRDDLLREARADVAKHPGTRLGQALYNVAYKHNPAVARLASSDVDPFNDDTRIPAFLDKLEEIR